jgi:hypothetical protein
MDPQNFSITFRIRHPHIDPAELSRQLGILPQHAWRAGEPRRREPGEASSSATHRETYWVGVLNAPAPWAGMLPDVDLSRDNRIGPLAAAVKTGAAQPQVTLYFTLLKMKRAAAFWRAFVDEGGTIECRLQVHDAESFHLEVSQALLLMIVELKIGLSLEVDGGQRAGERAA